MPALHDQDESHTEAASPQSPTLPQQHSSPTSPPSSDDDDDPVIPSTPAEEAACSFTSWFPPLRRHTIPSRILPLPPAFVEYLMEDGVHLPHPLAPTRITAESDDEWSDEGSEGEKEGPQEEGNGEAPPFFPALISAIDGAIDELGGAVYPRMDRLSPSDAVWITADKSMRCTSAGDVLLLLKASDAIADALTPPSSATSTTADGSACHLVLRRWSLLYPSSEFRCFVHRRHLLAISQRDANYYHHLTEPSHREHTRSLIIQFVQRTVLPALEGLDRFVCDVYVDTAQRVWLINVKVWGTDTDPALLTWKELVEMAEEEGEGRGDGGEGEGKDGEGGEEESDEVWDEEDVEYRVVGSEGDNMYMRSAAKRCVRRLPQVDGIDLSDAASIERFIATLNRQQA